MENYEHGETLNEVGARMRLPSVSTALLLAAAIGTIEALALYFGAGIFLSMMGISTVSHKLDTGGTEMFFLLTNINYSQVMIPNISMFIRSYMPIENPYASLKLADIYYES